MAVPAFIPLLDLGNHLELGPNCPPDDVATCCKECPDSDCAYRKEEG